MCSLPLAAWPRVFLGERSSRLGYNMVWHCGADPVRQLLVLWNIPPKFDVTRMAPVHRFCQISGFKLHVQH